MPRSIVPEKNFDLVFRTEDFGTFFYNQIQEFNWRFLLYGNVNHYYVPDLVKEFYKSFTRDDISDSKDSIYLTWRGQFCYLNIQTISEITGIEIMQGHQEHGSTDDYLPIMGIGCNYASDRGIRNSSTFRNIHTTARWLNTNVLGSSHNSSFYLQALHIIHCLMINDRRFCMCRQLMNTIVDMYIRPRLTYPVPILVTMICSYFMGAEAFHEYVSNHEMIYVSTEHISLSYRQCISTCWVPHNNYEQANLPIDESSSSEDVPSEYEPPPLSFYDRPHPRNQGELNNKMFEGMKGIVHRQIQIDRKLDQILDDKEGGVGPSNKRKR